MEITYGQTKDPARHREMQQWNDVNSSLSKKHRLQKVWKMGNKNEEKHLEAKRNNRTVAYLAKFEDKRIFYDSEK